MEMVAYQSFGNAHSVWSTRKDWGEIDLFVDLSSDVCCREREVLQS